MIILSSKKLLHRREEYAITDEVPVLRVISNYTKNKLFLLQRTNLLDCLFQIPLWIYYEIINVFKIIFKNKSNSVSLKRPPCKAISQNDS